MSTLTNLGGRGFMDFDMNQLAGGSPAFGTGAVIDAAGELTSVVGRLWHPSRPAGTFKIRKIGFRCGAVTFNILSNLTVSLRDVSLTAGPPYQPDATDDQTYVFSLGTGLTANDWNWTGNLSADRTVTTGDMISIVWSNSFTALDSIIISTLDMGVTNPTFYEIGGRQLINTAGTWALINSLGSNVAFECDDGTNAFLLDITAWKNFGTASVVNNSATTRAAGNAFTVPVAMQIDRFALLMTFPNNADGNMIIYDGDGTTALVTQAVDNDAIISAGTIGFVDCAFPPITLAPATTYRAVFVSSSTTATTLRYGDVASAGLLDFLPLGSACMYTERDSAGTWTQTTTRRAHMGMAISGAHDGTGGSGGPIGTNFRGGFSN